MSDSVAIVSGGLDSTVLVYDMISQGYTPHMLSFNYGQRHNKELRFAEYTATKLGLQHDIVDLTGLTKLISNSALTSRPSTVSKHDNGFRAPEVVAELEADDPTVIEVPEGHYAEDSMKATVVPNRNMIMLSIAGGVAVNNKYRTIGTGVHGGDHFIYPDCRPPFIFSVGQALLQGNEGFHNFNVAHLGEPIILGGRAFTTTALPIFTPYLNGSKADIAYRGIQLNVPFEETWSCYKGEDKHCGRCGTCVERLEAIDAAEQRWFSRFKGKLGEGYDKTVYADDTFWKRAVNVSDR
jgi:7-cyano-7-deazaguanine synthase